MSLSRRSLLLLGLLLVLPCRIFPQSAVPVLMLSDIHFDPFHDPGKVAQLRAEPIERWAAVLSAPPSATQAADLAALQASCGARALDTPWPLLEATLAAAHAAGSTRESKPVFLTLSGDLLTHEFPCRFQHTSPGASSVELSTFAAKTIAFVLLQLRNAYPHSPVYGALGNNDSGCGDYRETPDDSFVRNAGLALAADASLPEGDLSPEGDYAVVLPTPFQHGRLIVLQDIFEARQFSTCANDPSRTPEAAQMDWLRGQLAHARQMHEHVWVMAHIPPGVDVFTSYRRFLLHPAGMCGAEPHPFLADTALPDALLDYADVVSLALLGHTHMDEMRLLQRSAEGGVPAAAVPAKLVPSVSPIFGNHPAFLVAAVDPRTMVLRDWRTFVSPSPQGSAAPWVEAYRFSTAYHLPDFSATILQQLAKTFTDDPSGQTAGSTAYRDHFYAGDPGLYALGLAQIWPAYACAVREYRSSAVRACVCQALPAKPQPASPAEPSAHP